MTLKEVYAILKEIEDHVEDTCCAVTMDPLDVKDLIMKYNIKQRKYFQSKYKINKNKTRVRKRKQQKRKRRRRRKRKQTKTKTKKETRKRKQKNANET